MSKKQIGISKEFPNRLKKLRNALNWSQQQMADKVGADTHRISKYERGIICPTADMIVKMANVLGVSLDYLLLDNIKENVEDKLSKVKKTELLEKLEQLEFLPKEDQKILVAIMDTFIKRYNFEKEIIKIDD